MTNPTRKTIPDEGKKGISKNAIETPTESLSLLIFELFMIGSEGPLITQSNKKAKPK